MRDGLLFPGRPKPTCCTVYLEAAHSAEASSPGAGQPGCAAVPIAVSAVQCHT